MPGKHYYNDPCLSSFKVESRPAVSLDRETVAGHAQNLFISWKKQYFFLQMFSYLLGYLDIHRKINNTKLDQTSNSELLPVISNSMFRRKIK